jgi:hypothetical protein
MSASLFLTNALPLILVEPVLAAIRGITLRKEAAFLLQLFRFLMLDAQVGTGISKYAFNAQITSSSIAIESVFLFPISVQPLIILVLASVATKDTTSRMENAQSLQSSKSQI